MNPADHSQSRFWQKAKRFFLRHIWLTRALISIGALAVILGLGSLFIKPVDSLLNRILSGPRMVGTFFTDPLYNLPSYDGRTNILFLGKGGGNHEGADLTDTIIFIALDLKNTEVIMLSIPRDIWVSSIEAKINSAYYFGEAQEPGGGYPLIEDAVYEIVDQPIHYVTTIDFDGFEHLIDLLGGVEIKVDRSFVDLKYPIEGLENDECGGDPDYKCRYETIEFKAGTQHMNGATALKFSRSRNGSGDDGTDFARSARQQKVIQAIKEKLASSKIFLNPQKLLELKNLASQYVEFDQQLTDKEYAALAGFGYNFWRSGKEIKTIILETGDDDNPGFLVNPPIGKYDQWVLEPRSGDWVEFQDYLRQILKD